MAEITPALAAIWKKNLPVVQQRMAVLKAAADELATTRTLDPDTRAQATSAAHKFAGSLGMFGLHEATEVARGMEEVLEHDGLPQPERLQQQVTLLDELLAPHLQQ